MYGDPLEYPDNSERTEMLSYSTKKTSSPKGSIRSKLVWTVANPGCLSRSSSSFYKGDCTGLGIFRSLLFRASQELRRVLGSTFTTVLEIPPYSRAMTRSALPADVGGHQPGAANLRAGAEPAGLARSWRSTPRVSNITIVIRCCACALCQGLYVEKVLSARLLSVAAIRCCS